MDDLELGQALGQLIEGQRRQEETLGRVEARVGGVEARVSGIEGKMQASTLSGAVKTVLKAAGVFVGGLLAGVFGSKMGGSS